MTEDLSADIAEALNLMSEAMVILDRLNLHHPAIHLSQAIDIISEQGATTKI